jgi:hypothetical protein
MKIVVLLLSLTVLPACGDDSPTSPSPTFGPRTGTWVGPVSDPVNGSGTLRAEITELTIDASRSLIGGSWAATFAESSRNAAGNIGGIRSADELSITAYPATAPSCTPAAQATPGAYLIEASFSATEITGTYRFSTCRDSVSGTIALRRQ